MKPSEPSPFVSRRSFITAGAAAVVAAWAGVAVQSRLFPAKASSQGTPVEIPLAELPVGATKEITYAGAPALVMRSEDGVLALSLICTHLGCTVRWQAEKRQFHCPCHDGRFDELGDVTAGPPPLPLERLPVKVVAEKLVIGGAG